MSFYLPCGCVSPEIGKLPCKPVVDLIESQLSVWGLQYGLRTEREDTIRFREGKILMARRYSETGSLEGLTWRIREA